MHNELARARLIQTMRLIFASIMLILTPSLCLAETDSVIISEVLYDPIGTETGGEAVEIFNPTDMTLDISGLVIRTESSAADATVPDGTTIPAGGWYLIADSGWSTSRDDPSWPDADLEEPITLYNTDSGVALIAPNGTILDAVGWGNNSEIADGLYEGTPAAPTVAGESLQRTTDTGNNIADFSTGVPDVQNSQTPTAQEMQGNDISIDVDITNIAPSIEYLHILADDDQSAGIQIIPTPEDTRYIPFQTTVHDPDGNAEHMMLTLDVKGPESVKTSTLSYATSINSTSCIFNGTLPMEYYDRAGTYGVTLTASDGPEIDTLNTSFEYLSMAAIYIDVSALRFIGARLGSTTDLPGDFALSTTDAPTIKNTGNTPIDFGIYATDLSDGEKTIAADNIRYSFDNDFTGDLSGILSTELQLQSIGLSNGPDAVTSLGFQLYVPSTTPNGNYTGSVTVVAVSS